MKLPRKITISGFEIKITYKKKVITDNAECFGTYDTERKVIELQRAMHPTRKAEVFLHELIHAIDDVYRLHIPDTKTTTLALALIHVLIDNKIRLR